MRWNDQRIGQQGEYKERLAQYVATHFIGDQKQHAMTVQIASGTQMIYLMDAVIKVQKDAGARSLDLGIMTNNLDAFTPSARATLENANSFGSWDITLTGGTYHAPTRSLYGPIAADQIEAKTFAPDAVFFGVFTIAFTADDLEIYYHFRDQLVTQRSYALRPTKNRVVVFDHTKLGVRSGNLLKVTAEEMLEKAENVIFCSSWPDDREHQERIEREIQSFQKLSNRIQGNRKFTGKRLTLRLIGENSIVTNEYPQPNKRPLAKPIRRQATDAT
jgi:DeoR/GlpR family transcriptional regulator of sugar metabolism